MRSSPNKKIQERAEFNFVRYANCWEDADVLLKGLNARLNGSYLSIASSGDNTFSILSCDPALVLAVDLNPAQLACVELRKVLFAQLSHQEVLQFLGIEEGPSRLSVYSALKSHLPEAARSFWDANPAWIESGIIHMGKFEKYFHLFRRRIMPLIHSRKTISALFEPRERSARERFYNTRWDNRRWRWLFKIFFSRKVMGRLGRDPEFFKYVKGNVSERILQRAKYALVHLATDQNPYLDYILNQNFTIALPHYLRKENFEAIRANLDKLVVYHGNIEQALKRHNQVTFDGFNLSDIFEYMSEKESLLELTRIVERSNPGARLVYWNMLVDRKAPAKEPRVQYLEDLSEELFSQDKAFFYKRLIVEEVT